MQIGDRGMNMNTAEVGPGNHCRLRVFHAITGKE
jgi:hypothetical protein